MINRFTKNRWIVTLNYKKDKMILRAFINESAQILFLIDFKQHTLKLCGLKDIARIFGVPNKTQCQGAVEELNRIV